MISASSPSAARAASSAARLAAAASPGAGTGTTIDSAGTRVAAGAGWSRCVSEASIRSAADGGRPLRLPERELEAADRQFRAHLHGQAAAVVGNPERDLTGLWRGAARDRRQLPRRHGAEAALDLLGRRHRDVE